MNEPASAPEALEPDDTGASPPHDPQLGEAQPPQQGEAQRAAEAKAEAYLARQQRKPLATWTLAITIAVVFGLQVALGGADVVPVMSRLGALLPDRVLAGEVWRLVSSSFLHAGFAHFALNTWVLLVLGPQLERLLGTARFVVLYTAATLGAGAVAVAFSGAPLTVGASGGIFGLLAAEAMFVFTPRAALLPPDVLARRRRAAIINVVLNIAISFRPNVSMSAHAGGALVGALLVLVGFAPSTLVDDLRGGTPTWLRALASVSTGVLALGLIVGITAGGALGLATGMQVARVSLPQLGLSAAVPVGLAPVAANATEGARELAFGNPLVDPAVVALARVPLTVPIAAEQLEVEMTALADSLSAPPEGAELVGGVARRSLFDRPAVLARYHFDGGLTQETFVLVEPTFVVRVDVVFWDAFAVDYRDLAEEIAHSIDWITTGSGAPASTALEAPR